MQKEYTRAVLAYLMALEVDQENLEPALHCASCLYQSQEAKKAELLLDQVITKAGDAKEYAEVKAKAITMKRGRR